VKFANPYLNFPGNTEEVFNFYKSIFGGDFPVIVRFRDFGENPMGVPEADLDKIAHIALPLGASMLMGTDTLESMGKPLVMGNNFYITLDVDSAGEADRIFDALSGGGGSVEMPLQQTEWAEKYGCCMDKYGVQWMVSYAGSVQFSVDKLS